MKSPWGYLIVILLCNVSIMLCLIFSTKRSAMTFVLTSIFVVANGMYRLAINQRRQSKDKVATLHK